MSPFVERKRIGGSLANQGIGQPEKHELADLDRVTTVERVIAVLVDGDVNAGGQYVRRRC